MILVYPGFKASYYLFYLRGILEFAPGTQLVFTGHGFPRFHHHCLAFILDGRRIYISAGDGPGFGDEALEWCDVYAKINLDQVSAASHQKLFAIGPSFGINLLSPWKSLWWASSTFVGGAWRLNRPREHFGEYWRQWRYRLPLEAYTPSKSKQDYVFFVSSLWKEEPEANLFRANFIRACVSVSGLQFEGGLIHRPDVDGFDDVTSRSRVTLHEYIAKTKASLVAFNTPAVCGCHGWKLGEYLALGKAIISTSHQRALPAPLEHGIHLHYVDGSLESISKALEVLRCKPDYRMALEKAARAYYDMYLAPIQVVKRIVAQADEGRLRRAQ